MKVSSSDIIFKTPVSNGKIYVKEQKGFYQGLRAKINWLLVAIFVLLPFCQYQGRQAIWFDLSQQQFHFFAVTLLPQDFMAFTFLFIISAFSLFWVSSKYGRVWCGFTCPQTVWTILFMWVENKVEGNRQRRIRMDQHKWDWNTYCKKIVKHSIWIFISLMTSTIFMSYFVPATEIYIELVNLTLSNVVLGWIIFFTICTYLNAGLVREKMCQHMCPYARFQSVMVVPESKVVTYDVGRGEHRGPRKINKDRPSQLGDCVDCKLCVEVCPVGIDIRNGFQAECINCALCIDACDVTMKRFNYKKGLIKFASQSNKQRSKSEVLYLISLVIFIGLTFAWAAQKTDIEMTLIKDRLSLYQELESGLVKNLYQIRLINKKNTEQLVKLKITDPNLSIAEFDTIRLKPLEQKALTISIFGSMSERPTRFTKFEIIAVDANSNETLLKRKGHFHWPPETKVN